MKTFEGQYDNEELLMVFRKHPIAMRKGYYLFFVPFVLSTVPYLIWPYQLELLWLILGGTVVGLLGFSYFFIGWYFSVFLVTNRRMRQITQAGLFNRSISDLDLDKAQNISMHVPGLSASLFGFGTIVVQTFVGEVVLDKLHKPEEIYNQLLDIVNRYGAVGGPIQKRNEQATE